MTVAVPETTAPTPPWRPPTDPDPELTADSISQQPLSYHGNFSLSFIDDGHDVTDDEVDAEDLRSILELAEQCAFGISVKDNSQEMYPKEVSATPAPLEGAIQPTHQPCRFRGVKRKLDFDCCDELAPTGFEPPDNGEDVSDVRTSSGYQDKQRILEVSIGKMKRMEDPETSLRQCVLINNMTVKLRQELHQNHQQCPRERHRNTTVLPKKRPLLRRADTSVFPPTGFAESVPQTPGLGHEGSFDDPPKFLRRITIDGMVASCDQDNSFAACKMPEYAPSDHQTSETHKDSSADDINKTTGDVTEDITPSVFGDIDNVFQSLLSCLGETI